MVDTYLSPLRYTGPTLSLSGKWEHHPRWGARNVDMVFHAALTGTTATPPATIPRIYFGGIDFSWGLRKAWQATSALSISAGAEAELDVGCMYLPGNGNNPATAKAGIGLGLSIEGSYQLHIGKLPVAIADEVRLPSVSAFFSQQYGEPYYEIYLGNHRGLVHAGWWGNRFCIDNLLSARFHLSGIALIAGYRFRVNSSYVCSINYQRVENNFVIGISF